MLPDDLPENVIPFRPRKKRDRPRAEERVDASARVDHIVNTIAGKAQPGNREITSVRGATLLPALPTLNSPSPLGTAPMPSAGPQAAATADHASNLSHPSPPLSAAGRSGDRPIGLVSQRTTAPSTAADRRSTTDPAAANPNPADGAPVTGSATSGNRLAHETARATPGHAISQEQQAGTGKAFSWRRTALLLAGSFLLGIGIAWAAIAIGADIVGVWPHGFAFYIMLVGGGMTMLLTSALMMALFYSDSSGHDAVVHQFRPVPRQAQDLSSEPERKIPGGPKQ
ncbi:MAG TPA: hypothetical protein VM659_10290 [Dongiaceae bacterium]|nr:hypothetical protein [Dongiaceae bacterium]